MQRIRPTTFPPILDLLDAREARVIGLPCDDEGIVPGPLQEALGRDAPSLLVLQPRAQNPRGSLDERRMGRRPRRVLADHSTLVPEDDHAAYICSPPGVRFYY